MEEVGTQVASPIFIHQPLTSRFYESHPMAKKRSLPFQTTNFQNHQQQDQQSILHNPKENWNPKLWDWDNVRFVAKPKALESDVLQLGTTTSIQLDSQRSRRSTEEDSRTNRQMSNRNLNPPVDEEGEVLQLKLGGGGGFNFVEEPISRPNKKVRSGSPGGGGGGNYPMCQVDNCQENLSNAKDYHRRHKVCDVHSKAGKALVGKQMQRFCQQCSRFHPLSEFDEGKRSCRRRLAGHNKRRRKTQPEDVTSRLVLPGNTDNNGNGGSDIVNLLTALAHARGNAEDRSIGHSPLPNKEQLIQILSKINSLPLPPDFAAKLPVSGSLSKSFSDQMSPESQNRFNGNASSPSTMDLLAALSTTPAALGPDGLAIQSQRGSQGNDTEKTKSVSLDQATCLSLQKVPALGFSLVGGERGSTGCHSPVGYADYQVHETRANLPLQLFSSSPEDDSPPKLASARKYFSSDSSNPIEERSPSSSPPLVQKLFPVQTARETPKHESMSTSREVNGNADASKTHGCVTSLELFGGSTRGVDNHSFQNSPYQPGYTSSSGSDHSPSSLSSDAQDRSGRIIFKLFDKDPSDLPGTLRTQIYNWLSLSPSDMESYIRPGCVVLSIYMSMSSSAWEQLEENLLQYVNSLIQDSDSDFWRSGRFLLHSGRQLVSHKDGESRLCKYWRAWSSPDLISVSPLAVVGGQETTLLLRGKNLTTPGTRIHCTHTGGCTIKEVQGSACQETIYDEITLGSFTIYGAAPSVFGRCFIEVENCFRGTSFPVIIADTTICQELRLLEFEIDECAKVHDAISEDHARDYARPRSRDEVVHFLNELGWLFQRKGMFSIPEGPDYTISRFKFLFIFSVERDFCALVKTLLDILLQINLCRDGVLRESLEMLSEIHLLNRAVKRRCRNMVDLLMHYSVRDTGDTSMKYFFLPNLTGPGGITPLHLAACTSSSDDMVDALTSDPQEIGLHCWDSLLDDNGLSPYAYASMRNNHSYNTLVALKLADRKNGQVSVSIGNEIEQQWSTADADHRSSSKLKQRPKSCSECAIAAAKYNRRIRRSQGLLHRPYIHSMLAIAAVCVCVCLFLRGAPDIGLVAPFKWENLGYGPI